MRDPGELDARSRAALEDALAAAGFVLEVTRIHAVEEEVEIRNWRVETRQGPRSFQTRRDDWPRKVSDSGFLIRDVSGDLYHVRRHPRAGPREPGVAVGVRGVAADVTSGSRGVRIKARNRLKSTGTARSAVLAVRAGLIQA